MSLITQEQKERDPDWWDHLKPGDCFHAGDPSRCGVCGCESDYYEIVRWMGIGTKLHLICPGNKANRELHQKIDRKRELLYRDNLPPSATRELKVEIVQMINLINAQALSAAKAC
jgi:hypothetical protein